MFIQIEFSDMAYSIASLITRRFRLYGTFNSYTGVEVDLSLASTFNEEDIYTGQFNKFSYQSFDDRSKQKKTEYFPYDSNKAANLFTNDRGVFKLYSHMNNISNNLC